MLASCFLKPLADSMYLHVCSAHHNLFTLQVLNISSLCMEVEMRVVLELGEEAALRWQIWKQDV